MRAADKAVLVAGRDTSVMTLATQTPQGSWVRIPGRASARIAAGAEVAQAHVWPTGSFLRGD